MELKEIVGEILKRYEGGEDLPGRKKIQKEFGISEGTARKVLAILEFLISEKEEKEEREDDIREMGIDPFSIIEFDSSWADNYENPYLIEGEHRIGVISDVHFPFHDKEALTSALRYLYKKEVDILILNGDIVDFMSVSKFRKRLRHRNLQRERDFAVRQFEIIRTIFRDTKIIFKAGNHEERLQVYLQEKAQELEELEEFDLRRFLRLDELGFILVEDAQIIRAGYLDIIHGHEYKSFASINIAISYLRKTFHNVLLGHVHRRQEDTIRNSRGETVGAFCVGCLCHLRPEYQRKNNWQHGFAYVELYKDGFFTVENKVIEQGRVL